MMSPEKVVVQKGDGRKIQVMEGYFLFHRKIIYTQFLLDSKAYRTCLGSWVGDVEGRGKYILHW